MKMTWLDYAIRLGDRLADLTERGVVALEKLAGVDKPKGCAPHGETGFCEKCWEAPCHGCQHKRDDHPNVSGCTEWHEGP